MSAPFVTQLRSGRPPIQLAEPGKGVFTIRVEAAELWDSVRVIAPSTASVGEIRQRVVETLFPNGHADEFVLKYRGWEMLDLSSSLASAGVVDGAILLMAYRRRRQVR